MGKTKKSNPYGLSLKKAEEHKKKKIQEKEEKEKLLKQKKVKKRERYNRKRILLRKTKKGQPILSSTVNMILEKVKNE
ncbi:hypothetical protein RS030_203179 [Cryptosporidium xiaoi]|uniref:rRNA-processing protein FYV7 n=1 Tax=Cryptosporidium xiaoi TaxID=659607 RepID=A0AAV9XXN9_9CRYT